jgi:hypothetical protein
VLPNLTASAIGLGMAVLSAGACSPRQPESRERASGQPASFVNRVWMAAESTGVQQGQLYVFLSDGSMVIASREGTPSLGYWSRDSLGLVLVEDGIPYATDIVELTPDEFRIRSHNPGGEVEIRLVPAPGDASPSEP